MQFMIGLDLTSKNSTISLIIVYNNSSHIEKILSYDNVTILIKSVFNKNKIYYYYIIPLGKGSYDDKSHTHTRYANAD